MHNPAVGVPMVPPGGTGHGPQMLLLFDTPSSSRMNNSGVLDSSQESLSVGYRSGSLMPVRPRYTTGLFDVCDDPHSSVEAVLCSCCLVARMYNMLMERQPTVDVTCCSVMAACAICPLPPCTSVACGTAYVRGMAHDRLELSEESTLIDCLVSFCCMPCSIAQMYRELSLRRLWPGSTCSNERPYRNASPSGATDNVKHPLVMARVFPGVGYHSAARLSGAPERREDQRAASVLNPLLGSGRHPPSEHAHAVQER